MKINAKKICKQSLKKVAFEVNVFIDQQFMTEL